MKRTFFLLTVSVLLLPLGAHARHSDTQERVRYRLRRGCRHVHVKTRFSEHSRRGENKIDTG